MKKFIIVKCEKKEMGITMIALVITIVLNCCGAAMV